MNTLWQSHFDIAEGASRRDFQDAFSFASDRKGATLSHSGKQGFLAQSSVSVYLGAPMWWARAVSRSKVDEFVPETQRVNLRTLCQSCFGMAAGAGLVGCLLFPL